MHPCRRIVVALLLSVVSAVAAASERPPRSVLILDQSGPGIPGYLTIAAAFRASLNASAEPRIAIYAENLDLTLFGGPLYEELLRTYLRRKYAEKPIGVILAIGSAALQFALGLRTDQWSDVPIAFAAVDEDTAARLAQASNVTGTTVRLRFSDMVRTARALVPNLKRIALVGDPLEKQAFRRHFVQELPQAVPDLQILDLSGMAVPEVKARVGSLPADSAIVFTAITLDAGGSWYTPDEALAAIAEVANRPIVVDVESRLAAGGTGGFVILPAPIGTAAAHLVRRIFQGERPSEIPIESGTFTKPIFAWPQVQRWGVTPDQLPPGSEIRFRRPNVWQQYRIEIVTAIAVLLVQSLVIAVLLFEHRRRRRAEVEAQKRLVALTHLDRVASAERLTSSLAHELNQPLGAILSNADAAELVLAADAPNIAMCREILADIRRDDRRAADIIKHLRGFMKASSIEPQEVDLNDSVREVCEIVAAEAKERGIALDAKLSEHALPVRADPVHLQQVIFNLAQNAMDSMTSSEGGRARLTLQTAIKGASDGEVSVADTGTGIAPDKLGTIFDKFFTTKSQGMGLGLSIARTIVETYGGRIWAENRSSGGAVIRFTLPLRKVKVSSV